MRWAYGGRIFAGFVERHFGLSARGMPLMEVLACLNGEIMPIERALVPVWDRGFLFGDSVYEVFRMYAGGDGSRPSIWPT